MRVIPVLLLAASAFAAEYTIDTARSSAGFAVTHILVNTVRGTFSKVNGKISYDPKNLEASKVEATIDASTIDSKQAKRDAHQRSEDFLDVEKYPTMSFQSSKWWREGGKLKVAGNLTIHGVTKPVVLDVEGPSAPDGAGTLGATATTKINRKEFNILWNKLLDTGGAVAGDEVQITLDIKATKN